MISRRPPTPFASPTWPLAAAAMNVFRLACVVNAMRQNVFPHKATAPREGGPLPDTGSLPPLTLLIYRAAGVAIGNVHDHGRSPAPGDLADAIGAECHARGWRTASAVTRGLLHAAFVDDVAIVLKQRHLPEDTPTPATVAVQGREHVFALAAGIVAYSDGDAHGDAPRHGRDAEHTPHAFAVERSMWPGTAPGRRPDDMLFLSGVSGDVMADPDAVRFEDLAVLVYVKEDWRCGRTRSIPADEDAAKKPRVFIHALPESRNVRDFLVTQKRGTCYIAAALNVLFGVPALRHFMISVLNTELVAAELASVEEGGGGGAGGAAQLLARLEGPFRVEPLRTAMLRLTARHLCGERALDAPVTHILEVIMRPGIAETLAGRESPGGDTRRALGAMLVALGAPGSSVLLLARHLHVAFPGPRHVRVRGLTYSVEAMTGSYHVAGRRGKHAVTGVMDPSTGKRFVFNPWGVVYNVDWLFAADLEVLRAPGEPDLFATDPDDVVANITAIGIEEAFMQRHARPERMRPLCLQHLAGRVALPKAGAASSLSELGALPGQNVDMTWIAGAGAGTDAFQAATVWKAHAQSTCVPEGECAFDALGYPTSLPRYTYTTPATNKA